MGSGPAGNVPAGPGWHPAGQIAAANIVIALLVLSLKALAAWWSGSIALYSDAVESIVNVATAGAAFAAVLYSRRPADANHPFGHDKAEYFVALFEAILIGAAAISIAQPAFRALIDGPPPVDIPPEAYAANLAAAAVNGVWCTVLIRRGRALKSTALVSDGWHLLSDVVSSVGVLAGVALAQVSGHAWLDPLLALIVAVNILWSGWRLLILSFAGLMDMAPDPATQAAIHAAIERSGGQALQAHDLRARVAGPVTFIEFHLVVAGDMTVNEAHRICDEIEETLRQSVPGSKTTIHVEPTHKAHAKGGLQLNGG